MGFRISTSLSTRAASSITTTAMAHLPTSRRRPGWPPRGGARAAPGSITTTTGVCFSAFGHPRSGIGVDASDYDQDCKIDLFLTTVDHEMFSLYHQERDEIFSDVAPRFGIASQTFNLSGMGVKFFDYDNDGNPDIILSNGHPELNVAKMVPGVTYEEPMLLFRNTGNGSEHVSNQTGPTL